MQSLVVASGLPEAWDVDVAFAVALVEPDEVLAHEGGNGFIHAIAFDPVVTPKSLEAILAAFAIAEGIRDE